VSKKSFADIKALKKPNEVSVEIILDPELTRSLQELERRLRDEERHDARENRAPKAPALRKEIEDIKDQIEDSKAFFVFKDPGRKAFEQLVEACPASAEDKKKAKEDGTGVPGWDTDTFVPGLLALASYDPAISLEEAQEIFDDWGRGDVEALFNGALQACLEQASIPFTRRDTEAILASVQNLISASNTETPTVGI
jgi:hypothetical protein